jgi:hypothetical protein
MSSNTKPVAMPKIVPPQLPMNFVTALPYAGICCADFMASGSCLFDSYILAFWADEALASNGATNAPFREDEIDRQSRDNLATADAEQSRLTRRPAFDITRPRSHRDASLA